MKIEEDFVKGEISEILPNIFVVTIKDGYDRSMLFCRYQEYYESPFKEIKGNDFSLEYFMRLYTKKNNKKYFSYPDDWSGYNIPSKSLFDAHKLFKNNLTEYDKIMCKIIHYCDQTVKEKNDNHLQHWYLIGVDKLTSSITNHELAHGLYYTNPHYKAHMDYLVMSIKPKIYESLKSPLIKIGYDSDKTIIDDEIQAYMSTGKLPSWNDKHYELYHNEFKKVFKQYNKRIK